ncbi:MAG: FxSxx-COOH system tetratricopeptide repeat protein [Streptosporangiaceae bacterium]
MALSAAVSPVLSAALAIVPGLAVGAVPRSWTWAHSALLLWGILGVVVVALVWFALVAAWSSPDRGKPREPSPLGDTLPPRNPTFAGRKEELAKIGLLLADELALVLRGPPGAGKSLLALEYARQARESGRYQLVGWVRADSSATIARGLAALAPLLGLPANGTASETAAQVVAALGSRRGWLVVFDNAQTPGDLMKVWPRGDGHVLITSRNRGWNGLAVPVDLRGFSRSESLQVLHERSGSDEPEAASELARELGDLPLALAQAADRIDNDAMTFREYLALYRDQVEGPLLRDLGLDKAEYPASMAQVLRSCFSQLALENPAAAKLLWLSAFLDPDDIDLGLLSAGGAAAGDVLARMLGNPLERDQAVQVLVSANLATLRADGHLQVSRLAQTVARDRLISDDRAAKWAKRALKLIKAVAPPVPADHRSWPVYAALAPHIKAVTRHTASYPLLSDTCSLLNGLGIYLAASKQLAAARTVFGNVLAISVAAGGTASLEAAKAGDNLAVVQYQRGELEDARGSNEQALETFLAVCGRDHPETARSYVNRGVIQQGLRQLRKAKSSSEEALDIFRKIYGTHHPDVARIHCNLGAIELELGEFEDAGADFERALAIFRTASGSDPLEIAGALLNLGIAQREMGRLRNAQASIEQALVILEPACGADAADAAIARAHLAVVQRRLKEVRAAYTNVKRALTVSLESNGPGQQELVKTLVSLSLVRPRTITGYLISRTLASDITRLESEGQQSMAAA